MGRTRTSGIINDADGGKTVNKQVCGERIYKRLGSVTQDQAEAWLAAEIRRIELGRQRGTRPRVTFREAAHRYLSERLDHMASADDVAWHIRMLDDWIGNTALDEVFDESLAPFKRHRLDVDSVSLTTVNRSFEVVRRILNLAARSWRHPNKMTWLESAPIITIERNRDPRREYPLSWEEQDLLFAELPEHPNRHMALFKVNTGTREQEVCALEWGWEVQVRELNTSVFLIPWDFEEKGKRGVKNGEDRLVVLNGVARSVVDARRGMDRRYVFTYRGERLHSMNNTAWQNARKAAADKYGEQFGQPAPWGFANVRVHDLKHTFGRRLRAAGVSKETRKVLLGHKDGDITTHYSTAELAELINAVNRIDRSLQTPAITLLRVAA